MHKPKLSQQQTNGGSHLGTYHSPRLGKYVNGPKPGGSEYPWGNRTARNTNPYVVKNVPNTGVTRRFDWIVTNTTLAPDGVPIPMLVVNGQFPGPLIEANWGDWIEVSTTNALDIEGTAIHWHGFLLTGTPWEDGTPGVATCPIAPGKTFTSRFRAELYGSSWWHSHYSSQYVNGLSGPIVIHGPASDNNYDIDVGPVMLTDWFHDYYVNLVDKIFFATPTCIPTCPPLSNNVLINGKNNYHCNNGTLPCTSKAGQSVFKFHTGKRHRLRLINHSAEAIIFFSIDGYILTVIANDFVPVEPYQTDLVTLSVGQRTDIIVQGGNNTKEAVWMRMTEGPTGLGPAGKTGCSLSDGKSVDALAAIYYEDANTKVLPNTTSSISLQRYLFPLACGNQPLAVTTPAFVMPAKEPTTTLNFLISGSPNATGAFVWYMNNQTYYADYNDPTLLEAKLGSKFKPTERVFDLGTNSTVRIVMTSIGFPISHPMHIHGHNFQVLAEGFGTWNGSIVNAANPQRRDVQLIRPDGYLVIQIDLNNPGVWPLHCHVAWHASQGLNINILEQTPTLRNQLEIPYSIAQTCRDWSAWTGSHVVPQIDSGL